MLNNAISASVFTNVFVFVDKHHVNWRYDKAHHYEHCHQPSKSFRPSRVHIISVRDPAVLYPGEDHDGLRMRCDLRLGVVGWNAIY